MNERDTAARELLEEGLRSYVRALAAIRTFKTEAVKGCRTVLEEGLPILSRSLGVSATKAAVIEELDPSDIQKFGEDWAWIGVGIQLVPEKLWFSVGIYLDDTRDTRERVQAYAGFYTARKDTMKSLFRSLAELRGKAFVPDEEDYAVHAVEPVREDALASYQDALRTAMKRWLEADGGKPLSAVAKAIGLRAR
jgi:hypothetical protein